VLGRSAEAETRPGSYRCGVRALYRKHSVFYNDLTISTLLAISAVASLRIYDELGNAAKSLGDPSWFQYLFTVAIAFMLMARRKYPLGTLIAVTAAVFLHRLLRIPEYSITSIMWFLAIYAAGADSTTRWRTPVRAATVSLMTGGIIYYAFFDEKALVPTTAAAIFVVTFNLFAMGTAWALGDSAHRNTAQQRRLRIQNLELEASRDDAATQAVINERLRIARELHDVVAHHVSVIGIQAGAARRTLEIAPEKTSAALEAVEDTTREVMDELHALVGLLREDSIVSRRSSQPTLDRLPTLINQISDAGLTISLVTWGTTRELPASVELTAYRIAQEALTNVLRHAGPDPKVKVDIRYEQDRILVGVEDDGRGSAAYGNRRYDESSGNGVAGMRERVALHGGSVSAGPRIGGGWKVQAQIPVPERATS